VEVYYQRFEKYAEGEDKKWRAKEQPHGTYENYQPTVKELRPLTGHFYSGREMGSMTAAIPENPLLCKAVQ
jgi:hypothetical protein